MAWKVLVSLPFVMISVAYFAELEFGLLLFLLILLIHWINSLLGLGFGFLAL